MENHMKLRALSLCLLSLAVTACGNQGTATPPAATAGTTAAEAPTAVEYAKYYFAVPDEAVAAIRFDPSDVPGEKISIHHIALVNADGTSVEMDPCAPKGVQKVRIGSVTRTADGCDVVFGTDDNTGWMGLSQFNNLAVSSSERYIEIEMSKTQAVTGPFVLFDTGSGYNFRERVGAAASLEEAIKLAGQAGANGERREPAAGQ
jgi:hypothetical protein